MVEVKKPSFITYLQRRDLKCKARGSSKRTKEKADQNRQYKLKPIIFLAATVFNILNLISIQTFE